METNIYRASFRPKNTSFEAAHAILAIFFFRLDLIFYVTKLPSLYHIGLFCLILGL